jgi:hypothetical protein
MDASNRVMLARHAQDSQFRIIGRAMTLPALITVVTVLIESPAAVQLLIQEVAYPRLDEV